ncbi:MAG: ParA family protein [Planctomycetes bacterium]|nr:ParA family protein [Planctomycetota bacterium]
MQVLAFVNQKGGCGKTTSAVHLAGAFARLGLRTLLVDLDPQAHATLSLSCAPAEGEPTVLDVLTGGARADAALFAAPGGVWLLPATIELARFEEESERVLQPERRLAAALEELAGIFDVVLLDCPPRVDGVLAKNALRACDTAVLVVETGAFALQGALKALVILEELERELEHPFDTRVLATLFDRRVAFMREVLVALELRFGAGLFDTVLRQHEALREAAALGAPIQVVDPASDACLDFDALAAELLSKRLVARASNTAVTSRV